MKYEMGRKEKDLSAFKDGVDFWNRMIALLTYRLHSKLLIKASGIITNDKTLLSEKNITDGQNFHGKTWVVHTG